MGKLRHQIKNKVISILYSHESARDDDSELVSLFWIQELSRIGLNPKTITAYQLLEMLIRKRLTNPDTITRRRRQAQKENPNLRGKKYESRLNSQNKVKHELGYENK